MQTQSDFRGLGDWFEVFRVGTHTDSAGNTKTWTHAELDEMVANHRPAPFVCGHPKTDAPAYAWSAGLKRDGDVLLAKGDKIHDAFEKGVEDGRYPNRSVRIVKGGNGYKIGHVGFLGAAPPAIEGLAPIHFEAEAAGQTFEFSFREARKLNLLQRLARRIRDAWIDQHGLEKADNAIPEYLIDDLAGMEASERADALAASQASENRPLPVDPSYSLPGDLSGGTTLFPKNTTTEAPTMSTFTQAQLEEAVEAARAEERAKAEAAEQRSQALEFTARCRYHQGMVDRLISDDARLTPAQAEGLAEFMAQLERVEAKEFEFTVGEGNDAKTAKATLSDFFGAFITKLPKQLELGRGIAGQDAGNRAPAANFSGQAVDPARAALDQRARDYMAAHPGTDYVTAVATCENQ